MSAYGDGSARVRVEDLPALYKVTGPQGEPLNGGHGYWPVPTVSADGTVTYAIETADAGLGRIVSGADGRPLDGWRTVDGPLVPCSNGLHLTDGAHLSQWLPIGRGYAHDGEQRGYRIWLAEIRPTDETELPGPDGVRHAYAIDAGDKFVVRSARLLPNPATAAPIVRMERMHAARDRARNRAERAYTRATAGIRALDLVTSVGDVRLPAGHPLAAMVTTERAARAERERAYVAADGAFDRAYGRAFEKLLAAIGAPRA